MPWTALFGSDQPPAILREAWRNAAIAEQKQRFAPERAGGWSKSLDDAQADLAATAVVLAPSTVDGKAGGLMFLHDPYILGPYVHGPYLLTIPQKAFAQALSPTYRGFFAGEPLQP